ncbi:MAG: transglutaminase domain-containing protein, partial [Candidatus Bipolaricaulia bacterium]
GNWTYRDYDEYVLNPNDDSFMRTLAQSLRFSCYYRTVKNALAFVQAGINYELDPAGFEYPRYPAETLVDQAGDCEDTAILYASIVRTLGVGALIAAVDTSGDGRSDHMVAFVPVGESYADYGIPCAWEYGGRLYAFAETATEGGYTPLGVDPWGLEPGDIQQTWDVARVDTSPKMVKRLTPPTP